MFGALRALEQVQQATEVVSRVTAYIGGSFLLVAALLVTVEVVIRKVFTLSMGGADELSGYALASSMSWGYAYALFRRSHIRVDALYVHLPLRAACLLDIISLLAFAWLIGLVNYHAYVVLTESIRMDAVANTPLQTPLWLPQGVWLSGFAFFLFCIVLLMVRSLLFLASGEYQMIRRLAGAPSVQEELDVELEDLRLHDGDAVPAGGTAKAAGEAAEGGRR
ncbi:MAG: TRAP transporter small permease [Proteobacteria bacterium]|nr:TRAP transporter small permease [Pseudomonadota bacterium]